MTGLYAAILAELKREPLTCRQLAQRLRIQPRSLAPHLCKMERDGRLVKGPPRMNEGGHYAATYEAV